MLDDVEVLYGFCRLADDLADDLPPDKARQALGRLANELQSCRGSRQETRAFFELCRRKDIDLAIPLILVRTLAEDIGPVRMADYHQLLRFCYGAASTVGLMMCAVMGMGNPWALPYAVDLGLGMQLTNIARDVLEDAERDRVYLPGDEEDVELDPKSITTGDQAVRAAALRQVHRVLHLAETYYRSADQGMRFIPNRPRLAIITASRLYEAIGNRIVSRSDYWSSRTVVPASEKARLTVMALQDWLFDPTYKAETRFDHQACLHTCLQGLPGVNHAG
jgi:phytoene synthase